MTDSVVYVGGDSFCKYRTDTHNHWPAKLASLLGKELRGQGFEGETWWKSRKHLLDYIKSPDFERTDLFVFCHTDPHRILSDNQNFCQNISDEIDNVRKIYYTYLHNTDISNWTTLQWYKELNSLLEGRQVIHLQCFNSTNTYFECLQGLKFSYPLVKSSLEEINQDSDKFMLDARRNHFSSENNLKLADFIFQKYTADNFNTTITDNFLDHRV